MKDYYFGSSNAEVVITAGRLSKAEKILETVVIYPQLFNLKYAVDSEGEMIESNKVKTDEVHVRC